MPGGPPAYQQIEQWLTELMTAATLTPGDKLPKEADLAHALGVSRMTLRQALAALEAQRRRRADPGAQRRHVHRRADHRVRHHRAGRLHRAAASRPAAGQRSGRERAAASRRRPRSRRRWRSPATATSTRSCGSGARTATAGPGALLPARRALPGTARPSPDRVAVRPDGTRLRPRPADRDRVPRAVRRRTPIAARCSRYRPDRPCCASSGRRRARPASRSSTPPTCSARTGSGSPCAPWPARGEPCALRARPDPPFPDIEPTAVVESDSARTRSRLRHIRQGEQGRCHECFDDLTSQGRPDEARAAGCRQPGGDVGDLRPGQGVRRELSPVLRDRR